MHARSIQPKYISRLIETAEVRKRDRLRAEDKMVQKEREREGDEFADKDAFVTPAYLAQQEELKRIEAEEQKKEGQCSSNMLSDLSEDQHLIHVHALYRGTSWESRRNGCVL